MTDVEFQFTLFSVGFLLIFAAGLLGIVAAGNMLLLMFLYFPLYYVVWLATPFVVEYLFTGWVLTKLFFRVLFKITYIAFVKED